MSRDEQVQSLKTLVWMFWWLSIWAIPAPFTSSQTVLYAELYVVLSFPLALAMLAGTHRLLFPQAVVRWHFTVHVGAASVVVLLLFAPAAFRVSMAGIGYKPMWLVTTTIGTVAGVIYLLAYVNRFVRAKPPNKSLERTREG
jgi:hypothetical protein